MRASEKISGSKQLLESFFSSAWLQHAPQPRASSAASVRRVTQNASRGSCASSYRSLTALNSHVLPLRSGPALAQANHGLTRKKAVVTPISAKLFRQMEATCSLAIPHSAGRLSAVSLCYYAGQHTPICGGACLL